MFQKSISLLILILLPFVLLAHGSHGNGVISGFTHPIFGLDHAIAILGTGILGYILNPSKWYLYLLAFLVPMIIAGLFGINNEATFFIEKVIAFSVFAIGCIIAVNYKISPVVLMIALGIFGGFHGYAHGAEMGETNTALKYISGYAIGTFLVGVIGMFLAKTICSTEKKKQYINILGGSIMGAGVMMLLG